MTTIVFREGVMAADSNVFWGDCNIGKFQKIYDLKEEKKVVGFSGATINCDMFLRFLRGEEFNKELLSNQEDELYFRAMVYDKVEKTIGIYDSYCYEYPDCHEAPYYALGSGKEFALGAMASGSNAREAVEIASMFDKSTGGEVVVVDCW